jgi:hypothetical protein
MEKARYYYSRNGTDVNGPVTEDVLSTLLRGSLPDSTIFLCREGETHWEQLDSEAVTKRRAPVVPLAKTVEEPYKRRKCPWYSAERQVDPHFQKKLVFIAWCGALAGAAVGVHLRYVAFPEIQTAPQSMIEVVAYFIAAAAAIASLPCLLSVAFPYPSRRMIRAVGIVCFAALLLFLRYDTFANSVPTLGTAVPGAAEVKAPDQLVLRTR